MKVRTTFHVSELFLHWNWYFFHYFHTFFFLFLLEKNYDAPPWVKYLLQDQILDKFHVSNVFRPCKSGIFDKFILKNKFLQKFPIYTVKKTSGTGDMSQQIWSCKRAKFIKPITGWLSPTVIIKINWPFLYYVKKDKAEFQNKKWNICTYCTCGFVGLVNWTNWKSFWVFFIEILIFPLSKPSITNVTLENLLLLLSNVLFFLNWPHYTDIRPQCLPLKYCCYDIPFEK